MDMFCLKFPYNNDLIRIQADLARQFSPGIRLQEADSLHLTLVAMDDGSAWDFFVEVDMPTVPPFMFESSGLELIDTPQGDKVVVLMIEPSEGLRALQERLYVWAVASGMKVGEFYEPSNWMPHITLGRTEQDLGLPAIQPLAFAVNEFYLVEQVVFEDFWSFPLSNMRRISLLRNPHIAKAESTRSVELDDQAYTCWRMLGFPFVGQMRGGPRGMDFHETWWDRSTDLGWEEHVFPVYMDHATSRHVGRELIGFGRLAEETDDGRLVELYVAEANRYHNLLKELDDLGYLRGSGQAIASCYDVDNATRHVDVFHVAEYSFTVTPSNLYAAPVRHSDIQALLRKYEIEVKDTTMNGFDKLLSQYSEEDQGVLRSFDEKEQTAFLAEQDEEKRAALITAKRDEETPTEEDPVRVSAADKIKDLFREGTPSDEQIANIQAQRQAEQLEALTTQVSELQRQMAELLEANYALAENLVRNLPTMIAEVQSSSQAERDRLIRNQPLQPLTTKRSPVSAGLGSPLSQNGGR